MEAFKKVNVLYKEPRVRTLVKKVIKDLKCGRHTSEIQKPEDIVNATIQSQSVERHKSSEDISKTAIMKKTNSDGKISETKSETDDVNNEIKNGAQKASAESKVTSDGYNSHTSKSDQKHAKTCSEIKTEQEEKWAVEKIDNARRLETSQQQNEKKIESQLALTNILMKLTEKQMKKVSSENLSIMHSLITFITQSSCDVEILRKIMYSQVSRRL